MSTNSKGVLAVMDDEATTLANEGNYNAATRLTEARATVERMADALSEAITTLQNNDEGDTGPAVRAREALAAFRGEA